MMPKLRIAQRSHTIPHLMMKSMTCITVKDVTDGITVKDANRQQYDSRHIALDVVTVLCDRCSDLGDDQSRYLYNNDSLVFIISDWLYPVHYPKHLNCCFSFYHFRICLIVTACLQKHCLRMVFCAVIYYFEKT